MTLTRTSPFWGGATSISSTFKGSFAAHATAALHLDSKEEERGKRSTKRATRTQICAKTHEHHVDRQIVDKLLNNKMFPL